MESVVCEGEAGMQPVLTNLGISALHIFKSPRVSAAKHENHTCTSSSNQKLCHCHVCFLSGDLRLHVQTPESLLVILLRVAFTTPQNLGYILYFRV